MLEILKKEGVVDPKTTVEKIPFYKETGEDSFAGRVGIHEILEVSETLRNMIIAGEPSEKLEEQAKKEGMLTMLEDGIYKAASGITTIEEVFRVVSE